MLSPAMEWRLDNSSVHNYQVPRPSSQDHIYLVPRFQDQVAPAKEQTRSAILDNCLLDNYPSEMGTPCVHVPS